MSDVEDANEAQRIVLCFLILLLLMSLALLSDSNRPFLECLKVGSTVIMLTLSPV